MELPAGMGRLSGEGGHGNDGDMLVWIIVFVGVDCCCFKIWHWSCAVGGSFEWLVHV